MKRARSPSLESAPCFIKELVPYAPWWGDSVLFEDMMRLIVAQLDTVSLVRFAQTNKAAHACYGRVLGTGIEHQLIVSYHGPALLRQAVWRDPSLRDNSIMFDTAAQYGTLDNCKWLKQEKWMWGPTTFMGAVMRSDGRAIEIMAWLHNAACPWDKYSFYSAIERADFKLMEWLYTHKCPWEWRTLNYAIQMDNLDVFKWLVDHRCPTTKDCLHHYLHSSITIHNWCIANRAYLNEMGFNYCGT